MKRTTQNGARRSRWIPDPYTVRRALMGAGKLTNAEVDQIIKPAEDAYRALREGVGSEVQWGIFASYISVSQRIEKQGVVRGLDEHLHSAEVALLAINRRSMATGCWLSPELYLQEIDTLSTALDLHRYQLQQLSATEYLRASRAAIGQIKSCSSHIINIKNLTN
jgi:hypothetical protein